MNDFKVVPDFPGYEVSIDGEVRNANTKRPRLAQPTAEGYLRLTLSGETAYVHRLVMAAHKPDEFVTGCAAGKTVDHLDRDPANNDSANLRMATAQEQRANKAEPEVPAGSLAIVMTSLDGSTREFSSTRAAARATGIPQACISRAARGEYARAGGCTWAFAHVETPREDLPGETWKSVADADIFPRGRHVFVSNMGRFKESAGGGFVVKTASELCASNGYPKFRVNGKDHRLHRVVAKLFIDPPTHESMTYVRHADGDKTNAAAANLRWSAAK